ncbi:hypothetical protein HG531_012838 [Fusarium graminearum]|nr:hypothetical protein HG531_012838 [Fusarium graminearum]
MAPPIPTTTPITVLRVFVDMPDELPLEIPIVVGPRDNGNVGRGDRLGGSSSVFLGCSAAGLLVATGGSAAGVLVLVLAAVGGGGGR